MKKIQAPRPLARTGAVALAGGILLVFALSACVAPDEGGITANSSILGTIGGIPPGTAPEPSPVPATGDRPEAEQVLTLTNHYRSLNGLAPLSYNSKLSQSAQAFAEAMGTQGFFDHTAPDGSTPGDRITQAGYDWTNYGENIAYGYATPDAVMQGWINSPGHRANILGAAYKDLGVGFFVTPSAGGRAGTAYWVQDFGTE